MMRIVKEPVTQICDFCGDKPVPCIRLIGVGRAYGYDLVMYVCRECVETLRKELCSEEMQVRSEHSVRDNKKR